LCIPTADRTFAETGVGGDWSWPGVLLYTGEKKGGWQTWATASTGAATAVVVVVERKDQDPNSGAEKVEPG
jgi:hypothetical protein